MSHSKCHFSNSGNSTLIPYLHIVEIQRKLHQKSANTFKQVREGSLNILTYITWTVRNRPFCTNINIIMYAIILYEDQGWEFIKEKTKTRKKENTHASTQTRTKTRKKELVQENTHENTHSYKKTRTKTRTRTRKRPRKKELPKKKR